MSDTSVTGSATIVSALRRLAHASRQESGQLADEAAVAFEGCAERFEQLERDLALAHAQAYAFQTECHRVKDTLATVIPALAAASGLNADELRETCIDGELTRDEWAALWMARAILEREPQSIVSPIALGESKGDGNGLA